MPDSNVPEPSIHPEASIPIPLPGQSKDNFGSGAVRKTTGLNNNTIPPIKGEFPGPSTLDTLNSGGRGGVPYSSGILKVDIISI